MGDQKYLYRAQKSNVWLNVFINMETDSVSSIQFLLISQVFDCRRKSVTNIQKYNATQCTQIRTQMFRQIYRKAVTNIPDQFICEGLSSHCSEPRSFAPYSWRLGHVCPAVHFHHNRTLQQNWDKIKYPQLEKSKSKKQKCKTNKKNIGTHVSRGSFPSQSDFATKLG